MFNKVIKVFIEAGGISVHSQPKINNDRFPFITGSENIKYPGINLTKI